jgi:hypothetical protein
MGLRLAEIENIGKKNLTVARSRCKPAATGLLLARYAMSGAFRREGMAGRIRPYDIKGDSTDDGT